MKRIWIPSVAAIVIAGAAMIAALLIYNKNFAN